MQPLLLAWLLPLAVGVPAYGIAWAAGLARFDPPDLAKIGITGLLPIGRFAILLLLALTVVTLISALSAVGEEIGWRGFMLTRLVEAGVPAPLLVSGVVWALWHVPLILTGQYAAGGNRTLSAILFVAGISAAGCAIGFLRLSSGSIWPAVLLHAAWNAVIQGAFDASSKGGKVWIGESGLFVVAGLIALSAWLARGAWAARRAPGEAPFATLDAARTPSGVRLQTPAGRTDSDRTGAAPPASAGRDRRRRRNFRCLFRVASTSGPQTVWTRPCLIRTCQSAFDRL